MKTGALFKAGTILLCLLLSACAGTQSRNTDPVNDPWEGFNRKMYAFNKGMDKVVRPIAVGYDRVAPDPVKRGVGNFFRNLDGPVTFLNQVLQGKIRQSGATLGRFVLNTTIGVLGFFDVATKAGIPLYSEDLGQTLATWGYQDSRFLMLPVFGPSSIRDGIGRYVDSYYHPVSYAIRKNNVWGYWVARGIHDRATFLGSDAELEQAYDPYVLMRDVWIQNREFEIFDGDPPLQDYDLLLEEIE